MVVVVVVVVVLVFICDIFGACCANTLNQNQNMPKSNNDVRCRGCGHAGHVRANCPNAADSRKADGVAKRKATLVAKKAAKMALKAVQSALYNALPNARRMPQTRGVDWNRTSWETIADVCTHCGKPPKGCMCV